MFAGCEVSARLCVFWWSEDESGAALAPRALCRESLARDGSDARPHFVGSVVSVGVVCPGPWHQAAYGRPHGGPHGGSDPDSGAVARAYHDAYEGSDVQAHEASHGSADERSFWAAHGSANHPTF